MYKISIIHMSTRVKYSEIHSDHSTRTLAAFLERAVLRLPPFHIVFTDNHMSFTMKYTHHPERETAFTRKARDLGIIHALIEKGKPWRNGLIERSNRTDNEWLFNSQKFSCEEERRYQLRLWEMYYNRQRPHQGIDLNTPLDQALEQHFCRVKNVTLS